MKLALSNSNNSGDLPDPLSNRVSNARVRNALFLAAGALLYWALATHVTYFSGLNVTRLSPFFAGAAGYFLGFRAGTAASLAALVIHTLVFNQHGYEGPFAILQTNPAANIGTVLIGPMAGRLRTITNRLQREIERRTKRELELSEIEQRFQQIADAIQDALWICPAERTHMNYVSPAFEKIFGIDRSAVEKNPFAILDVVHPDDRPSLEEKLRSQPLEAYEIEYRIIPAEENVRWIQSRVFPVHDKNGSVQLIVGVSSDVTDSKNTAIALQTSETKYRDLAKKIPAVDDRIPVAIESQKTSEPAHVSGTVLVAQGEPAVQQLIVDVLHDRDCRVLLAEDGGSALEVAATNGPIDLLITDVVMPRTNGRELADELRRKHPSLKVLYLSGYIGSASVRVAELGPNTSFLSKPFSPEALARKIRLLIDNPPSVSVATDRSRPAVDSQSL